MKNLSFFSLFFYSAFLVAQTNLVPNNDFNKVGKKVKELGQINMAEPWISPTLTQADLYIKNTKSGEISTSINIHGGEDPMIGDNFAGFLAYSPKNKAPRSYLQVKFTQPLEQGVEYCVTFHVSLSDLSKFSCNYIGAYLSNDAVSANNNEVLQFDPQIVSRRLVTYDQQFYWTPICAKYTALGGEEYLTIGNFTPETSLKIGKVKRPQGYNTPQTNDAYYFVDNVIVAPLEGTEKCDCDFIPGIDDMDITNKNFKSDLSTIDTKVKIIDSDGNVSSNVPTNPTNPTNNSNTIFFESKKNDLSPDAIKKIDEIIGYLKSNLKDKLILYGYIDKSENAEDKLDGKRVGVIYKYIISKGVPKERVVNNLGGLSEDKDTSKNMKVEMKIEKVDTIK